MSEHPQESTKSKENSVYISYAWQEALEDMQKIREGFGKIQEKWLGRIHTPGERVSVLDKLLK